MFLSRHKKHFGFIFSILILLSPVTLWGGEVVACEDALGNGIQFEWHHNPHFISAETGSRCEHHKEEQSLAYSDTHEHRLCSGILLSNTMVFSRNVKSSFINSFSQPFILGIAIDDIALVLGCLYSCGNHAISLMRFHNALRSTILRC